MATAQRSPALRIAAHTRKTSKRDQAPPAAVPVGRVREMLREIAFVLHATRVVGRMGEGVATKQGRPDAPLGASAGAGEDGMVGTLALPGSAPEACLGLRSAG